MSTNIHCSKNNFCFILRCPKAQTLWHLLKVLVAGTLAGDGLAHDGGVPDDGGREGEVAGHRRLIA